MIPRTIHYCWFGRSKKSALNHKCISSWKEQAPDYEIIEWSEDNFDVLQNDLTKYCYDNGKWAFLSDLARLLIVYEHGGVYFDTDVQLIKPIDELLENRSFFAFENSIYVASGLGFGSEARNPIIKKMIEKYNELRIDKTNEYRFVGCPKINTSVLIEMGLKQTGELQVIDGVTIYPPEYFNPYDDPTGRLNITDKTLSIHHYEKSWMNRRSVIRSKLTKPLHRLFGTDCFMWLKGSR